MHRFDRIVYATYGTLNPAGNNCILLPTYYAGTDQSYLPMIGAGRALDPAHWFIVIPNMLGNGVSDSPSNNEQYAPATIADNVRVQKLLLESLGVRQIALVYGWSMGAMQGFAWAAMFPPMVEALLAVCGSAKCWPQNYVFIEGLKAVLPAGNRAFGRAYAGWAYSAAFYRDARWREMGFTTLEDFLRYWEDDHHAYDARDLRAMLWTWQNAALEAVDLARLTARTLLMPGSTDMYFCADEARIEARVITGAALRVLESPYGHCAGAPGRFANETAQVEQAIRDLLEGAAAARRAASRQPKSFT
jgi:homoserine O-acetyltransferase